jgi:hypothetical protein
MQRIDYQCLLFFFVTGGVFALAAWRARRGAKHGAEGEPRKVATPLGVTP